MVVVARALTVDPADEPDVEVGVAIELLVEAAFGVVSDVGRQRCSAATSSRGKGRHRRAIEIDVRRDALAKPRGEISVTSAEREGVSDLENVRHSIAETTDGIQCRTWVDDGRVAAVGELPDAEGLDAELDRPASVGRHVEECVRVERRADVDTTTREPLELKGSTSCEHREQDPQRRPRARPEASQARYASCIRAG